MRDLMLPRPISPTYLAHTGSPWRPSPPRSPRSRRVRPVGNHLDVGVLVTGGGKNLAGYRREDLEAGMPAEFLNAR
jgi:hypothetical protein